MQKQIVSKYEDREAELTLENDKLRSSLLLLQNELVSLLMCAMALEGK